jgi:hypothetical protein
VEKNRSNIKDRSLKNVVAGKQKSMYFWPISEDEIVTEVSKLKGKATAGCDGILDFLVKACITGIKNRLI